MALMESDRGSRRHSWAPGLGLPLVAFGALGLVVGLSLSATKIDAAINNSKHKRNINNAERLIQEKDLSGEHPIIDLREIPGFNLEGKFSSGFFVTSGNFRGQTTEMLQFAWKIKEDDQNCQISSVPIKNVRYFIVDDPTTQPTVNFTGITPQILSENGQKNRQDIENDNVNFYVEKASDNLVILTMSKNEWNKFRGEIQK